MPYPTTFPTQQMMQVGMFLRGGPNAPAKPVVLQAAYDCLGFGLATLVPVPSSGGGPEPSPPTPAPPPGPTPPEPPTPPPPPTGSEPRREQQRQQNQAKADKLPPGEQQKQAAQKADQGQQAEALKQHQAADQEELAKLKGEVARVKGQPGSGSTTDAESGKPTQASAEGPPQTPLPQAEAGGGPRAGEGGGPQAPGGGNVRGVSGDVKYKVEQPPKQGAELADELDGWTRDMTNRFGGAAGATGAPGGGFTHPEVTARQQTISPSLGAPSNIGRGGVPQSPHELPTTLAGAGQGGQYSFSVPPWLVPVLLNVIQQILQA
jgi:hypothetical protein